jgi:hypothetical protein
LHRLATKVGEKGGLITAEIRLRDDAGRFTTVPLHEATAAQIREATALMVEAKHAGLRVPKSLRKRMAQLADALPPAPRGTARGSRIRLTRGKDGRLAASFHAIPLDDLATFVELLRAQLGEE